MYQVHKYEMWLFLIKKHVKFGGVVKMFYSKYAPSLVIHFFIFWTISEYHASKNHDLLLRTILRAIFSHLRTNQSAASMCVTHQCKQVIIERNQVR